MEAAQIAQWPETAKRHKDGSIAPEPQRHASLKEDIWPRLWCRADILHRVPRPNELRSEASFIVGCHQDYNCVRKLHSGFNNFKHTGICTGGCPHSLRPFQGIEVNRAQELEHGIACEVIAAMYNEHSSRVGHLRVVCLNWYPQRLLRYVDPRLCRGLDLRFRLSLCTFKLAKKRLELLSNKLASCARYAPLPHVIPKVRQGSALAEECWRQISKCRVPQEVAPVVPIVRGLSDGGSRCKSHECVP